MSKLNHDSRRRDGAGSPAPVQGLVRLAAGSCRPNNSPSRHAAPDLTFTPIGVSPQADGQRDGWLPARGRPCVAAAMHS